MRVFQFDVLESTNDYMKENICDYEEYDIVAAKNQTKGKGRQGNIWVSNEGMAMFTFLYKQNKDIEDIKYLRLPLVAGIAVIRAMKKFYPAEYMFKWTNDIYVDEKKLAGILIEKRKDNFFIGIGINVNNEIPSELKNTAISMKEINNNKELEILEVIVAVVNEFKNIMDSFFTTDIWNEILSEINSINYLKGRKIHFKYGNVFKTGTVQDIDIDGNIQILSENGIESFGVGEVKRERVVISIKNDIMNIVKGYILKEYGYDVIFFSDAELDEKMLEKIKKLKIRLEKGNDILEILKKYNAYNFEDDEKIVPLNNYSHEELLNVLKNIEKINN